MVNQKIKIGFHSDARSFGGSEHYLRMLMMNIDQEKYDVYFFHKVGYPLKTVFGDFNRFISVPYDAKNDTKDSSEDYQKHVKPTVSNKIDFRAVWRKIVPKKLKYFIGLNREITKKTSVFEQYRLDLFHSNEASPTPDVAAIAARRAGIKKVVLTFHVLPEYEQNKMDRVNAWLSHKVGQSADAIIYNSECAKEVWSRKTAGCNNHILIFHGMTLSEPPLDDEIRMIKKKFHLPEGKIIIGTTGRLTEAKGQGIVIEAAKAIIPNHEDVHFVFAGEGEHLEALKQQVMDSGLKPHFTFLGHVEDIDEVTGIYDIALLPSIQSETFGFVGLEAMALCKPVIASKIGGVPEMIEEGKTGILISPSNPEELVRAINDLIQSPAKCKEMGRQGRIRAEKMFTMDRMLKETYSVYEGLVGS